MRASKNTDPSLPFVVFNEKKETLQTNFDKTYVNEFGDEKPTYQK